MSVSTCRPAQPLHRRVDPTNPESSRPTTSSIGTSIASTTCLSALIPQQSEEPDNEMTPSTSACDCDAATTLAVPPMLEPITTTCFTPCDFR
jgi:hypothetical protein